jgi:hypothetical protein
MVMRNDPWIRGWVTKVNQIVEVTDIVGVLRPSSMSLVCDFVGFGHGGFII